MDGDGVVVESDADQVDPTNLQQAGELPHLTGFGVVELADRIAPPRRFDLHDHRTASPGHQQIDLSAAYLQVRGEHLRPMPRQIPGRQSLAAGAEGLDP